MRTPVSYYGGKQNLLSEILPIISAAKHTQYVECNIGGGAVFWAKHPSGHECINDLDGRVTNFYWIMQTRFEELQTFIRATLHSELLYRRAKDILGNEAADPVERAWAFWVQTNMSFGKQIENGYAFDTTGAVSESVARKRENFQAPYTTRLKSVEIFTRDEVDMVKLKDTPDTLFYCDPPYVSSEQGHYKGYTREDFHKLLTSLSQIKGKFILSSYPEPDLLTFRQEHGWWSKDIEQQVSVSKDKSKIKFKTECITTNFDPANQLTLF